MFVRLWKHVVLGERGLLVHTVAVDSVGSERAGREGAHQGSRGERSRHGEAGWAEQHEEKSLFFHGHLVLTSQVETMSTVSARLQEYDSALREYERFMASPEYQAPTQVYQNHCTTVNQAYATMRYVSENLRAIHVDAWCVYEPTYMRRMDLEMEVMRRYESLQRAIARLHGWNVDSPRRS